MSKKTAKGLVPMLRFPEFCNAGEWGAAFGDKIFEQISNKNHNSDLPVLAITKEHGAIPREMIDYHVSVADKSIESYKVVDIGDFIISLRSFQGGIEYSTFKGICSPAYVILRLKGGNSTGYFRQLLKTDRFISQMTKNIEGLRDGKMVSYKQFSKLSLPIPSHLEQQKISDCLSSLDELIAAESQKLDILKMYRKGLMQQLFPAEGEAVPRLRFAGFKMCWERKKITSLLERISSPVEIELDRQYRQIGIRSHGKGIFHKEPVSGSQLGNKRVFWVEKNAFVVNIVFAWEQAVATTSVTEDGMIASHRFPMYRAKKGKASVRFFKYFFLTGRGKELLWLASPGGAGRNKTLGQKEFENLEFLVPDDVREQSKIANFLSTVDDHIGAQAQKLEGLKTHKKGLMQQLFPVADDGEGA